MMASAASKLKPACSWLPVGSRHAPNALPNGRTAKKTHPEKPPPCRTNVMITHIAKVMCSLVHSGCYFGSTTLWSEKACWLGIVKRLTLLGQLRATASADHVTHATATRPRYCLIPQCLVPIAWCGPPAAHKLKEARVCDIVIGL